MRMLRKKVISYTYRGHVVVGAASLGQQSVPDLPGEYRRALAFVMRYFAHHVVGRDPRFTAADSARPYRSGLVIPAQYLRHTTI
jgi:hypothetical protein